MTHITSRQANDLAYSFLTLAQAVGCYRYQNIETLSDTQNRQFGDLHWSILKYSDDLRSFSATLDEDSIQLSLVSIESVARRILADYNNLQDAQKAINVAGSIVT
jgi:hypothetical protein